MTGPVCGGGIQTRDVYCAQSTPASSAQKAKEGRQPVPGTDGAADWKGNQLPTPSPHILLDIMGPWHSQIYSILSRICKPVLLLVIIGNR